MEPFIAQIMMFGGNFAPRGWALCDGQLLSISQNTALFSILGTTYGGDGRTTFGLPDLRGRVAVHQGDGPGLPPVSLGEKAGSATTTLTVQNLPSHTHDATVTSTLSVGVSTATANGDDPDGAVLGAGPEIFTSGAADSQMSTNSIAGDVTVANTNTGDGTSFSNQPPFQGVNYIIALTGVFPSRS